VILDALNKEAVGEAIERAEPDVVIDELTSLPKSYSQEAMQSAFEAHRRVRLEGGANVQAAAEKSGARRYIVQSGAFVLAPGEGLADEITPHAFDGPPGIAATAHMLADVERRAKESAMQVVILRYGAFYGPGAWFDRNGDMADQVRAGRLPIAGQGQGVWSFVHVEDAAAATAASLRGAPGIYNVVDDQPMEFGVWLRAFAAWLGAPPPPRITEEQALGIAGADFVFYATQSRGASNAKARSEFGFSPRRPAWLAATAAPR
jgi:nucleoside-diphosphate-sugar epimerase